LNPHHHASRHIAIGGDLVLGWGGPVGGQKILNFGEQVEKMREVECNCAMLKKCAGLNANAGE